MREEMAKILCVLYPDPISEYPYSYARDAIPKIDSYPSGQTAPTPKSIDFMPGVLLGSVSGGLGLKRFLDDLAIILS
jgi:formate dehydrogenase